MTSSTQPLSPLSALQHRLRSRTLLHRFTTLARWMLAAAFIPSGMRKVMGQRFTQISTEVPIGSFFEAFFQAEEFYLFIGLCQVLAALLLLIPRTALLGALLFLPIAVNILVITVAMQFRGTTFVAAGMVFAGIYLLFWDLHRIRPLWSSREILDTPPPPSTQMSTPAAATLTAVLVGLGLGLGTILLMGPGALVGVLILVFGAALFPAALASFWETIAALWVRNRNKRPLQSSS